jgi:hypothetical protein
MSLSNEQLSSFVNKKCLNFFGKRYPVVEDQNGLPSLICISESKRTYSLHLGIGRHDIISIISKDLSKVMFFSTEESKQIAEFYLGLKYNIFKEKILSL